uniref:Uncharacterized protein n=1 Tax=Opuntia streptacantha TaxID=393608 RepID=A0A7C9DVK1_OPUST
MRRQCFSTLRLRAIFSPLLVQTGDVSCSLAKSFLTAMTLAPVDIDPMFNMRISPFVSLVTLPCFSVPLVLTPSSRRSRKKFTSSSTNTSGRDPTSPRTWPTNRSARVRVGSMVVPTPIRPPGTANCSSFCSAYNETILEYIGVHFMWPLSSFTTIPGRTSMFWLTFRTPFRILPPATPPRISSTSYPGLLTSKERITIMFGGEMKFLSGIGIFLTIYSQTTSMLYFN